MLCEVCGKKVATVHLTEVINDKVVELHICSACAKVKAHELKQQLSISEFLSNLVSEPEVKKCEVAVQCPRCGMSFHDFKKKGRLGCADCYETFKAQLIPLIKKIHGATHHKGKFPHSVDAITGAAEKVCQLKEQLTRAVQLEEYEEAARLRDQIKSLEKNIER